MTTATVAAWVVAAGAVATALTAIGALMSKIMRTLIKLNRLVDDWYGDKDRPGLTQRVDDLRDALDAHVQSHHRSRPRATFSGEVE